MSQELIDWADKIFVMSEIEDGHLTYLESHFDLKSKPVFDLDEIGLVKTIQSLTDGKDLGGFDLDGTPSFTAGCTIAPCADDAALRAELERQQQAWSAAQDDARREELQRAIAGTRQRLAAGLRRAAARPDGR